MDVEKTMRFILESQRQSERRADQAERKAARRDAQFDKKLKAIADLVRVGMKMVIEQRKAHKEMDVKLNALIHAQLNAEERMRGHEQWLRRHDEKFDRLLDAL